MPSTVIAHIDYDPINALLKIAFLSGSVYEYKHVPETVYRAMKSAFSKGTYFNLYIKDNYIFKKIK